MAHSMGGTVATALLPSPNISAIITMSTPHTLPPVRLDARIDKIYQHNRRILLSDPTPILSLCGGATDDMISSESCILPLPSTNLSHHADIYRRTVFTSALEGVWTGVGHREMVWCHQVRWRVAKAALELGTSSVTGMGLVLDKWLRDGHMLPPELESPGAQSRNVVLDNKESYEILSADARLFLKEPRKSRMYLLPVMPSQNPAAFVLFLSQGSIPPVAPQKPSPLRVSVYICSSDSQVEDDAPACQTLQPTTLRLVPNPMPGMMFPVPNEGSDESEGVVVFEANVRPPTRWVGVQVEDADGRGWVIAGMNSSQDVTSNVGMLGLCYRCSLDDSTQ